MKIFQKQFKCQSFLLDKLALSRRNSVMDFQFWPVHYDNPLLKWCSTEKQAVFVFLFCSFPSVIGVLLFSVLGCKMIIIKGAEFHKTELMDRCQ